MCHYRLDCLSLDIHAPDDQYKKEIPNCQSFYANLPIFSKASLTILESPRRIQELEEGNRAVQISDYPKDEFWLT